ncbi:hypothetical protein QX776_14285 [Alteromonadaceae bacterium BrNp21-10]|nr:hypothetical protein [Alteromonadaceae bacterium BrNp21-10]
MKPPDATTSHTVESFNLRLDTVNDGINAWPNRQQLALQHLQQSQPDVVGMQGVLQHQLTWLDEQLADGDLFISDLYPISTRVVFKQ